MLFRSDLRSLDVRADRQNDYNDQIQRRLASTTWSSGCKSWYLTDDGYNAIMYPGFTAQFLRQLSKIELEDYSMRPQPPRRGEPKRTRPELAARRSHGASEVRRQRNDDRVSVDKREDAHFSAQSVSPEAAPPRIVDRS